jgi:hypothetical protein
MSDGAGTVRKWASPLRPEMVEGGGLSSMVVPDVGHHLSGPVTT